MTAQLERFPIVGIGASAGGVPAMESFFKGLGECLVEDCGMAFVIVTHLSPDRESLLHEVVSRYTDLPVSVADDGVAVERNHVYVMPPNAILMIEDGTLQMRKLNAQQRERKPIDIFFSSLAKDQREYAVGIVLSGGDSDGTLGVKAIKERAGLTLAQMPDGGGPSNPEMPASAISSGLIDLAVTAEEMGPKLLELARSFHLLDGLERDGDDRNLKEVQNEIYVILKSHSGHDFSGYKTKTFMRRVRRRMQVTQQVSLEGYIATLREDSVEVKNLFRDLLIKVTNFFRDEAAFKVLEEEIIPKLFADRGAADVVRIWVPGCATGEEVFSIGMLMREHMETLDAVPQVQIFATDIDEAALHVARAARYPEAMIDGLSDERKQRFLVSDGTSYVVRKDVRELCIFSPHSVIRDPPFSRMDLVSCRNLLIYFGGDIQQHVIPTFHYSLKPGGYLFLGTSESISRHADLFSTVDQKHRIFQAREHANRVPRLPMTSEPRTIGQDFRRHDPARLHIGDYPLRHRVETRVIERFAPAHVVVNSDGDVVYYSARTGKYLEQPQGAPNHQLVSMARSELRLDLRSMVREAMETRRPVVRESVIVEEEDEDDKFQMITLTIEPFDVGQASEPLFLVLFTPLGPARSRSERELEARRDHPETAELERELSETRERLQSTIEEYETALEELKSSNEELVSVNEEAQSTNEELEASKEELQSLNEEMNTINSELNGKVEELDTANSDLRNLFEATEIATVFLDRNLVIRNFTPAASSFFSLLAADIGRPLTDLSTKLDYPELTVHIRQVFVTGEMVEHRIARSEEGKHYLIRLIPYRDGDRDIEGVVVTFIDVTRLADAEAHQQVLISELNHRVKNMLSVVITIANQTARTAPSSEAFNEALIGRLHAMARAYSLLSEKNWTEISVGTLVQRESEAFGSNRIKADGPDLLLKPVQALSIAMVLHELCTNAVKYGALSNAKGQVEISWDTSDTKFCLDWREADGPRLKAPEKSGFGLTLLKGEIEYRLGGTAEVLFKPDGLEVKLAFPFER